MTGFPFKPIDLLQRDTPQIAQNARHDVVNVLFADMR